MTKGQWTVTGLLALLLALEVLRSPNVRNFFIALFPTNVLAGLSQKFSTSTPTSTATAASKNTAQMSQQMKSLISKNQ
jgi:hypothetical protein